MAVLVWDKVGDRVYQTGIDRGVLYLRDGTTVPWNGLTGMEENSTAEFKSFYLDGVKYLDTLIPGDFSGKLKAYTYPEEFESVNGTAEAAPGLVYHDQPFKSFNLSYRTGVGNDLEGSDFGYKIHLLYNVIANPDTQSFETIKEPASLSEFTWTIVGTPPKTPGYRPTIHISIDSTETSEEVLKTLEDILYGTDTTNPRFPSIDEIKNIFIAVGALIIIDNGDGTWQAVDYNNDYITMLDATTFQIDNADAVYLDPYTYNISSTYPDE